jgi:hypothetical protein
MKWKVLWAGITGWMVGSVFVYLGGEGTKERPYQMATKGKLELLVATVDGGEPYSDTYFRLTADVEGLETVIGTDSHFPYK